MYLTEKVPNATLCCNKSAKLLGCVLTLLGKFPKIVCIIALYNRQSVPWYTPEESEACAY